MALTLVAVCSIYVIGVRADRVHANRVASGTVTEPGLNDGAGASLHTQRATSGSAESTAPGSVTAPRGLYRGRSAAHWAARFRMRTRQLQVARRSLREVIRQPGFGTSWIERAFLCIHAGEGSWTASTGNGFHGGLQMDSSFQATYGDWALAAFGTADHWPVSVQIATAIRAYASGRGFHPWPNTARACGLI